MEHSIATRADELTILLRDHLGVRGGEGFAEKLAYAGRRLPKWVHRDGQVIAQALTLEMHPKLARQIDRKRVHRAISNVYGYLDGVDPWKRRLERVIDVAAFSGFVAFAALACVLGVMIWRGLI